MTSSGKYSAFISYASENREKADEICASLEQRGLTCWIAPRNIRAGREYADEIIHGLERSAAVVLVLSEAANTSVFVLREIERAVSKDINVVPVRIEEVTPSPGLELFISGTHWMDVWRGTWDDHMDRLVRDLNDSSTPALVDTAIRHRSGPSQRSLRMVYVAAGLAVAVAVGVALSAIVLPLWRDTPQRGGGAPASNDRPTEGTTTPGIFRGGPVIPVGKDPDQILAAARPPGDREPGAIAGRPVAPAAPLAREAAPGERQPAQLQAEATPPGERPLGGIARRGLGSARGAPATQAPAAGTAQAPPPAVNASGELNALQDDYDKLSLRGEVIDEALNQLWEEMKPNSPRLDMVTHQRSLRTNLTRSKDALASRDTAAARRYLEIAKTDLAVLEQFLNR